MHGRGQTVPYSHAPVHAPFHTPPCPPLVHPSSPLLCTPPFRVPFWLHAESTRHKGCLHAAPHIAAPRCLVCAPPVGVLPQPSPLCLPLCPPSRWCTTPAPSLAPPLSACPVGCVQRVGAQWGAQMVFARSPSRCCATPASAHPSRWCAPSALSLAPPPLPALPLVCHPSPLPCAPPFRVPCWLHAESGGAMGGANGVCMQPPMLPHHTA